MLFNMDTIISAFIIYLLKSNEDGMTEEEITEEVKLLGESFSVLLEKECK